MPPRTVPFPSVEDFGTKVPALIVEDDDGNRVDVVFGADILLYLEWVQRTERAG